MTSVVADLRAAIRAERGAEAARQAGALTLIGYLAFKPGAQAVLAYRIARWLLLRRLRAPAHLVALVSTYLTASEIAPTADIGPGFAVMHPAGTVVAGGVQAGSSLRLHGGSVLGFRLGPTGDQPDGAPKLGDDVIVGIGAKVLGPVRIGNGALVGANAVVTRDVPAEHVARGIPATTRPAGITGAASGPTAD